MLISQKQARGTRQQQMQGARMFNMFSFQIYFSQFLNVPNAMGAFVAFPSAAPVYILTYVVTSSGRYSLAVLGTKTFSAANAKLSNSVLGAPFDLSVVPALPCASMSTFTVSPPAAQPAQPLSLTLISRDAYGNPQVATPLATGRMSATSSVNTIAESWLSSASAASDSVHNRYTAVLMAPTAAGSNMVFGSLGIAGSLAATYYSASGATVNALPPSIDFSVASGGSFQTFSVTFSARYAGAILLPKSSVQTFRVSNIGTADRFALVVGNKLLIDMLSSAPAANSHTTATITLPPSCNIYDVLLQYVCTSTAAGRGIALSLITQGVYVVPQRSVWYTSHLVASVPVAVGGGRICAGKCTVTGYAATASVVTAGIPSSFTIQAVDAYGNTLQNTDDVFTFAAVPHFKQHTSTTGTLPFHPPATTTASQLNVHDAAYDGSAYTVAASVASMGSGRYAVTYAATRSGWYYVRGSVLQAGGLYGVYMESARLVEGGGSFNAQPPAQRIDSVVDFDWGSASPLDGWASGG